MTLVLVYIRAMVIEGIMRQIGRVITISFCSHVLSATMAPKKKEEIAPAMTLHGCLFRPVVKIEAGTVESSSPPVVRSVAAVAPSSHDANSAASSHDANSAAPSSSLYDAPARSPRAESSQKEAASSQTLSANKK